MLGLANAGGDLTNTIKQAAEFGIPKTMKMAGIILVLNNIHALGLPTAVILGAVVTAAALALAVRRLASFSLKGEPA